MPRRAAVVGAMDAVDLDAAPDAAAHLRVEQDLGNARLVDEDAFLRESTLRRGPTPAAVGRAEQAGRLRPGEDQVRVPRRRRQRPDLHVVHRRGQMRPGLLGELRARSEEHTSELQSLMSISYAVFCLKKKRAKQQNNKKSSKL